MGRHTEEGVAREGDNEQMWKIMERQRPNKIYKGDIGRGNDISDCIVWERVMDHEKERNQQD